VVSRRACFSGEGSLPPPYIVAVAVVEEERRRTKGGVCIGISGFCAINIHTIHLFRLLVITVCVYMPLFIFRYGVTSRHVASRVISSIEIKFDT
jgi:hypothetical protein